MEYRDLGRTGVKVSPLCLGCMNFGGRTEAPEAQRIIHEAIEAGINFIDTANVYHRGRSEEVTGQAIRDSGRRERLVLATKVYGRMDDEDPNARGVSRRHILAQCEASLRRLETDYIDLYQIHRPDASVPIDETLRALDDLIRAGKVRYIGTSTFAAWQVVEALYIARELGLNRFVSEQPPYHLLERRIERELIPAALSYGLAIIPWSPLAGGFLTGKYRRDDARPSGSRYEKKDDWSERCFTDEGFDILEAAEKLADEKGCRVSQFSIAWAMHQPGITAPIIGPRTLDQLKDNLGALAVEITDEDRKRLDEVSPPGEAPASYYQADFGPHRFGGFPA